MNFRELLFDSEVIQVKGAVAAGTTDVQTFTEVDMLGYDSLLLIALLGTITSTGVAELTCKGSDTSSTYGSGTVDSYTTDGGTTVAKATATTGDSNKCIVLDLYKLPRRYAQGQIERKTANVVIVGAVAIRYNGRQKPTSQATANIPATGAVAVGNPVPSAA